MFIVIIDFSCSITRFVNDWTFSDLMLYRVSNARDSIFDFQRYLVRMYSSNQLWDNLQQRSDSSVAYCTTDWGELNDENL